MIDGETYTYQLGLRDLAALALTPAPLWSASVDVDELQHLPAILFTLTGDGQVANSDGLWSYTLTISTFGNGMDEAKKYARVGYAMVRAWDARPDLTVLEIDGSNVWVSTIDDIDLPSRLASASIAGRNLVQYSGSWALALRG